MSKKGKGKGGKKDDWEESEVVDFTKEQPAESSSASTLLDNEPEPEMSDFMAQIANANKKKEKSRKKRKDDDFESAIAETLATADESANAEEPVQEKKGKGGKGGKGQQPVDESEEPAAPAEEDDAPQKGGKKAKKGKKKDEEFWADIEKIQKGEMEPEEKPQGKGKQQDHDDEGADGQPLSAAAQKRREKKERQKQEAQPQAEAAKPAPAASKPVAATPAAPAAAAASNKKSPAAAIKLALQKKQEEEEKLRKVEEEAQKKWQEEEDARLEEERKKEEIKHAKKEKERLKKEDLKKQGLYKTKAEKEKQAQLEERRAKLAAQLGSTQAQAVATEGEGEEGKDQKPKKVVYGKRKKPQPGQKQGQGVTSQEASEDHEGEDEGQNEESETPEQAVTSPQASEEAPESWESWEDIETTPSAAPQKPAAATATSKTAAAAAATTAPAAAKPAAPAAATNSKPVAETPKAAPSTHASGNKPAPASAPKAASGAKAAPKPAESSESEDDSEDDSDSSDEDAEKKAGDEARKEQAKEKRLQRYKDALAQRNKDDLRSPICCILGHVDTGKTKLLDKIRQTNVQENEAGGITQQIGATYFPAETINEKIEPLHLQNFEVKVPGLLVIDTPGHESFTNLRSRGSSLCNIAILVIDIMHYLEPQTIESLNLLRQKKTPFIVALNKIDRIYSWQPHPNMGFQETLALQSDSVKREFEDRLSKTMLALAEQGLNAELYTRNQDFRKYISICPTSAISGEGIPDMIMLLVQLTQKHMGEQLMYLSELEATVLEVKVIEGQGTTIDVILSNGYLREGDKIAVCGMNGPIITNIRAILTPQPLRELRVKSQYVHNKEVKAALGVKISAPGLEKAIAGSRLMVVGPEDDVDEISEEIMSDLADLMKSLDKSGKGVSVQASTLGSLEALLAFLKQMNIPVFNINIGPVHKKDVTRASVMLEHQKEYATMLCFDVDIDKDAQKMADELGVQIFTARIIYHLFDQFTKYINEIQEQRKKDLAPAAVFPCVLKIVPGCIFNKRSPILVGVTVVEGNLRVGTPLCVPVRNQIFIGKTTGIEINHKPVEMAKKGQDVAIRIELPQYETPKMVGRHFEATDDIVSQISRESINILKETFREEVSKEEWALIVKLKKTLGII